jgi:hypothetical protein
MPLPQDLEKQGWRRSAQHPLFRGTWLMEASTAPELELRRTPAARSRSWSALRAILLAPVPLPRLTRG